MTDYVEEQTTELEVLRSIYPDEFEDTEVSDTSFRILLRGDAPLGKNEDEIVEAYLAITYTPTYPDTVPIFNVEPVEGDGELSSAELAKIMEAITEAAEENVGMAMVFALASTLKDQLDETLQMRQDVLDQAALEKELRELEIERARFKGTAVSKEAFLEWRTAFVKEMEEKEKQTSGVKKDDPRKGKLNGRQLFEKDASLAASDAKFVEEGDASVDASEFDHDDVGAEEEEEDEEANTVAEMLRRSQD